MLGALVEGAGVRAGTIGFGICGVCAMSLASALTNVFSEHARKAVDVASMLFSLHSLEARLLEINK